MSLCARGGAATNSGSRGARPGTAGAGAGRAVVDPSPAPGDGVLRANGDMPDRDAVDYTICLFQRKILNPKRVYNI